MLDVVLKYLTNAARARVTRQAPAESLQPDAPMWVKALHLGHGDLVLLRAEEDPPGLAAWAKELNARTGAMVLVLEKGVEVDGALRDQEIRRWRACQ